MTDQWDEELRCPQCSNTGVVSLSHPKDAEVPNVKAVPDGFKIVQTEYGPEFHCGTCNIPAAP